MPVPAAHPNLCILPGMTIGLIGGGQLGRMFGIAARRMGYRVHAMDPAQDCPAGQVADVEINRPYDDIDAARNFANRVDVVTFEFENVPAETLEAIEGITPVRPRPAVLHTCRHRLREKAFLKSRGFPHAEWHEVTSAEEVGRAVEALGGRGILKTALFGYDGKGQVKLSTPQARSGDESRSFAAAWRAKGQGESRGFEEAWRSLNQPVGVVEEVVPFDMEISAIVARGQNGQSRVFPIGQNEHSHRHILDVTTVPAKLAPRVLERASELGSEIAEALDVVGLLAVEMFVVGDEILVNELAPRTHNSGHWTFDACVTSQFEQQLRAVCGLPLGDVSPTAGGIAMANLLGDLWEKAEPNWPGALTYPNIKLHLYGKTRPTPGRKMGHLLATAATLEAARRDVLAAREALATAR